VRSPLVAPVGSDTRGRRLGAVLRGVVALLALAVTAVLLAGWFTGSRPPGVLVDHDVYRWAVLTWWAGGSPYEGGSSAAGIGVLPWVYPPIALLPLSVLGLVSYPVGVALLSAVSVAAVAVTVHVVVRRLWPGLARRDVATLAVASSPLTLLLEPVAHNHAIGQINAVLMALVVLDCLAEQPRWPRGVLVGVAAAVKLTPLVFLLYFVLRGQRRAALTATATFGACGVLGLLIAPADSLRYWFGAGPAAPVWGSPFRGNQSVLGVLTRLPIPPGITSALWLASALVLGALLLRGLVRQRADAPLAMTAIALFALLASPTSWTQHWVWVVPGLLVMTSRALSGDRRWWGLVAVTVLTVTVLGGRINRLPIGAWPHLWQHLVGGSYTLVGIVLLVLFGLSRREVPAGAEQAGARPGNRARAPVVE